MSRVLREEITPEQQRRLAKLADDIAGAVYEEKTAGMVLQRSRLALDKLTEMRSKIILESMRPEAKAKKMAERERSPLDVMIDKLAEKAVRKGVDDA